MELTERKQLLNRGLRVAVIVAAVALLAATCVAASAFSTDVEQKSVSGDAAQATKTCPEGCYKVGGAVTEPKLINKIDPVFPPKAKDEKRTGTCTLEMTIDETGVPQDIKVVKSLAPDFDESVLTAVKQWRFSPATLKGKPVPVIITTEVNFELC